MHQISQLLLGKDGQDGVTLKENGVGGLLPETQRLKDVPMPVI